MARGNGGVPRIEKKREGFSPPDLSIEEDAGSLVCRLAVKSG